MGKLFDFYINSSIHVALAVASLSMVTAVHFEIPMDIEFLLFLFFGSITGYNFVKFAGIAKLHHRSLASSLKIIQVFSFLSFLAFVYFSLQQSTEVLVTAALFGLFTLLYALPVFSEKRNLRGLKGLKVFVIAMVWAGATVVLPILNSAYPEQQEVFPIGVIGFDDLRSFGIGVNSLFTAGSLGVHDSLTGVFSSIGFLLLDGISCIPIFLEPLFLKVFDGLSTQSLFATPHLKILLPDIILEFVQRFLFILVLILPFEIRDLKYDRQELQTIPQSIGVERTKILAYAFISIWILLEFFKTTTDLSSQFAVFTVALITAAFVFRAREDQSAFYSSFWVEGIPMFWLILLLSISNFL